MDYKKIYFQIINRAKERILDKNIYSEKHHITPKCLEGDNDKTNIVRLLPREHFIAHWLLVRLYPENNKIIYSFWMMSNGYKQNIRKIKISSRGYAEARELFVKVNKGRTSPMKNRTQTEESKEKISKNRKNKYMGKDNHLFLENRSDELKIKMKNSWKKIKVNEATEIHRREQISKTLKGRPKPEIFVENMKKNRIGENNPYSKYLKENNKVHHASKKVYQYNQKNELINEWDNASIASKNLGINRTGINNCCNNKTKTSGDFIWKYDLILINT